MTFLSSSTPRVSYIISSVILAGMQWMFMFSAGLKLAPEFLASFFVASSVFVPLSVFFGMQLKNSILLNSIDLRSRSMFISVGIAQSFLALVLSFILIQLFYNNTLFSIVGLVLILKCCEYLIEIFLATILADLDFKRALFLTLGRSVFYMLGALLIYHRASSYISFVAVSILHVLMLGILICRSNNSYIGSYKLFLGFAKKNYPLGFSHLFSQGVIPIQRSIVALFQTSEVVNAFGMATQCIMAAQVVAVPIAQVCIKKLVDLKGFSLSKSVFGMMLLTSFLCGAVSFLAQCFILKSGINGFDDGFLVLISVMLAGMALGLATFLNLLALKKLLRAHIMVLNGAIFLSASIGAFLCSSQGMVSFLYIVIFAIVVRFFGLIYLVRDAAS